MFLQINANFAFCSPRVLELSQLHLGESDQLPAHHRAQLSIWGFGTLVMGSSAVL